MAKPSPPPGFTDDFATLWSRAQEIGGWLTRDQARALWDAARSLPPAGTVVEIGSHQGRSTVVLADAARRNGGARVVAIDPFLAQGMFGGRETAQRFRDNVERLGVSDKVELREARSQDVLATWSEPIDLLYVDGKHDYWSCGRDLGFVRHCRPGGAVFVHDAFSSFGVTTALLRHGWYASRLRYERRTGSLAQFSVRPSTPTSRRAFVAQLPWWTRNLVVKLALRTHAYPVARALGHDDVADPY